MSHSEICPVCRGNGVVEIDQRTTAGKVKKCHGCYGRGWVTVEDHFNDITITKQNLSNSSADWPS